jgi:hypothetical protein
MAMLGVAVKEAMLKGPFTTTFTALDTEEYPGTPESATVAQ